MAYSIVSARTKGWNGPWFRRKGGHNGLEHVVLRRRLRAMCQKRVPRIKCVPEKDVRSYGRSRYCSDR